MMKRSLIVCALIITMTSAIAGVYRVDRAVIGGTGDGSSWANAYSDLQSAINAAAVAPYGPHEVWVKAGTYKPNDPDPTNTSREQWFQLKNGVAVYGGFAGGEDLRAARDFEANETILSGDIGTEGDISDNCYHVFNHPDGTNLDATAILDGVTVTRGNADHPDDANDHAYGGGMVNRGSSPTLRNCTISRNYVRTWGGGIYNYQSSPTLTNCTIYANIGGTGVGVCNNYRCSPVFTNCTISTNYSATGTGGAMYNRVEVSVTMTNCKVTVNTAGSTGGIYQQGGSTLTMTNCLIADCMSPGDGGAFYSNSSTLNLTNCTISGCRGRSGGAFNLVAGSATITNCTIIGNEATTRAAVMSNDSSSPVMTNCTIYANSAPTAGGIRNYTSFGAASPILTNCILWDNGAELTGGTPVVTYCVVQGGAYTTNGNTGDDPNLLGFVDNGGLGRTVALGSGSSAIDAGDPASTLTEDQRGAPRPQGGRVDVGAYETGSNCTVTFVVAGDPEALLIGTTTQTVDFGKPCSSVRVLPSEGYRLVNWTYGGGTVLSTDTTVTAQGFTTNMTVTANLSNEYAISSSVVGNGAISPASASVNYANSQVCTITPDADHRIVDVQVDGVSVGPIASYGFIGVATDHEIRAIFEAIPAYNVTFTPGSDGSITGDSPQTILEGNDCTVVEAVPNAGYHFVKWTLAGSDYSTDNPLAVTNVTADMALTAVFAGDQAEIEVAYNSTNISDGSAASASLGTDFGSASIGGTVTRSYIIRNLGLATLNLTNTQITGSSDFTITSAPTSTVAASGSTTLVVSFAPSSHGAINAQVEITSNDADEGSFTFDLTGTGGNIVPVADGSSSDSSAAVAATVQLSGSGSYDPDGGPSALAYSWSLVSGPMTPSLSPSATIMEPTFVPTVAGTYVWRLTVDDSAATDQTDVQVIVGDLHTVAAMAGTGGDVRLGSAGIPGNSVSEGVVDGGDSSQFYALADGGYDFVRWSDGNTDNPRQFTSVSADISVTAQFLIRSYAVIFTAGTDGSITGTTPQTITHGSDCTSVTATPDADCHFVKWTIGASDHSTDAAITVTNVTADMALVAVFAPGVPEIEITTGSTDVLSGDTVALYSKVSEHRDYSFAISNTGTSTLNLTGSPRVGLSGADAAMFEVIGSPGDSVAASGNSAFVIRYKPTADGPHRATITIVNDDPDESTFTFTLTGTQNINGTIAGNDVRIVYRDDNGCAIGGGRTIVSLLPVILSLLALAGFRALRTCR